MVQKAKLSKKLKSKFVVLDGPDGCGKSTQQALLGRWLTDQGIKVLTVRDPGTTAAGEAIRKILLSGQYGALCAECELLLFMAARAQMMAERILPALKAGELVLADRFVSASCAYQGASGIDPKSIIEIGQFAVRSTWPHLTIVLDVPVDVGLGRLRGGQGKMDLDAMERRGPAFHEAVRRIFLNLAEVYPGKIEVLDASGPVEQVHRRIVEILEGVDF